MKRLLAFAVAVEIAVAGLAAVTISDGAQGDTHPFRSSRGAASTGAGDGRLERPSAAGWSEAGGPAGGGGRAGGSSEGAGASRGRPAPAAKGISFRAPVDFATGATPSSGGFNKVSGEQAPLMVMHLALSDSVVTGDFNRDGHADVVQTNVLAGSLSPPGRRPGQVRATDHPPGRRQPELRRGRRPRR